MWAPTPGARSGRNEHCDKMQGYDEWEPAPLGDGWDDFPPDPDPDPDPEYTDILSRLWGGIGLGERQLSSNNIWGADADNPEDRAIIGVLQTWALALAGTGTPVEARLPDPLYKWQGHVPSVAEIDEYIEWVSKFVEREWANWGKSRGFEAAADFRTLAQAQRLALMQELDTVMEPAQKPKQKPRDEAAGYNW